MQRNRTRCYRLDRRSANKLAALWKPEYDTLSLFNSGNLHGLAEEPAVVARMAEIQRDYDDNYVPGSARIWTEGKKRRVWW